MKVHKGSRGLENEKQLALLGRGRGYIINVLF